MNLVWTLPVGLILMSGLAGADDAANKPIKLLIRTERGDIEAELDPARAPATCANFLHYVDGGFYTSGRFHRTVTPGNQPASNVKIEVIQAGPDPARARELAAPVQLERTNITGLKHQDGTLSMARSGPDTATADFFICIGDQPELDFEGKRNPDGQGFAAFGKVTKGMELVRQIQGSSAEGQSLKPAIRILEIKRQQ